MDKQIVKDTAEYNFKLGYMQAIKDKNANDKEKVTKIRELKKIMNKINATEKKIRRVKKFAIFDSRYTNTGKLSDSCCELDDLKIKLFSLKDELKEIERLK